MVNQGREPQELIAASEHVLYEVHMLQATASGLVSGITLGSLLHNALTESFVVHARNLTHFLFPESPYPTDILAAHFFDDPERWPSLRGPLPDELKSVRRRASKEMAHITYDRLDAVGEARRWHYIEIFTAIQTLVEIFARNATAELLHSDWAEIVRSDA